jgi:hypothetical protein
MEEEEERKEEEEGWRQIFSKFKGRERGARVLLALAGGVGAPPLRPKKDDDDDLSFDLT